MWGVNSICSSIFGLQLFDLNLGSTPHPQAYVFFKIESFVPQSTSRFIFVVLPFEGQLHLWLQSHLCLTILRVNSISGYSPIYVWPEIMCRSTLVLDSAPDPYLGCTFEGQLHLWLKSHLCLTLDHVEGQLQMWIQFQIHICVVPFQDCTPSLAPVPSMSHLISCGGSIPDPYLGCNFLTLI